MDKTQHESAPNLPAASPKSDIGSLAAKMAHELNNPLDAALRFVSLARRKAKAAGDHGQVPEYTDIDRYLADAQFGLQRMAEVLRELMDLGRQTSDILAEARPPRGTVLPLADIIVRATRTAAALSEQKRVALVVKSLLPEGLRPVYDLRLAQILSNLLKNALEAAPENSAVRLTVMPFQKHNSTTEYTEDTEDTETVSGDSVLSSSVSSVVPNILLIQIEDAGPGIPLELLPKLFTPFLTTKPKGAGHGLGLAISHELALSLRGNLTVQNRQAPDTGCIATVTLPLEQP